MNFPAGALNGAGEGALIGGAFGGVAGAIEGFANPQWCFVPGTLIPHPGPKHEDGGPAAKDILDIRKDDEVLAIDQHNPNGPLIVCKVTKIYRRYADHLRILRIRAANGQEQEYRTTDDHGFGQLDGSWKTAGLLTEGSHVVHLNRTQGLIIATCREEHPEGILVCNFEVEDAHTYFVLPADRKGLPVWVHNADYLRPRLYTESPDGIRLFQEARAYRATLSGDLAYRNIVVADVLVNGEARTVRFVNDPDGMHSEQRLVAWDQAMSDRGNEIQVLRAYTDRAPCGDASANCTELLQMRYGSDFQVYFSQRRGPTKP